MQLVDEYELVYDVLTINRECTRESSRQGSMNDSSDQLRDFIDAIPTLAWSAGPDGQAESFNRHWLRTPASPNRKHEVRDGGVAIIRRGCES
jgi:hypothetical protein